MKINYISENLKEKLEILLIRLMHQKINYYLDLLVFIIIQKVIIACLI